MTEDQKDQPVTSNQDGSKQIVPTDQVSNQKQDKPANQNSSTSKESSETESTREVKEHEDSKHPHKQGVPVGSGEESKGSL